MSTRFIYGQDAMIARWAAARIGAGGGFPNDAAAIGMERNGNLVAATIWHCFERHNCLMSVASSGSRLWLTREFRFRSFAYPFLQLGLPRVTSKADEGNEASVKLTLHMGFKIEGRLRKAAPDGRDDIVFGMLKEECRWIGPDMARYAA